MNKIFKRVVSEDGIYIEIPRWNPLTWLIFIMDLVFGPLVVLFSKSYTFHWYWYELKSILSGRYYCCRYNEVENEEDEQTI